MCCCAMSTAADHQLAWGNAAALYLLLLGLLLHLMPVQEGLSLQYKPLAVLLIMLVISLLLVVLR